MYKEVVRFPFLNSLRFFAAFLVLMHHGESVRSKYEMYTLIDYSIFNLGDFAVTFFFVLSGFLITYLLLKEQKIKQTISIRNFYVRRILRIWPLYFLLVAFGLFIAPYGLQLIGYHYNMPYEWWQSLPFYVFFAPFMVNVLYGTSLLEPLWSIGVEELFYLLWAPAFKWIKRNVTAILVSVIVVKLIIGIVISLYDLNGIWVRVFHMLKFEAMAIGALGALAVYRTNRELSGRVIFAPIVQIIVCGLIAAKMFFGNFLIEHTSVFNLIFGNYIISGYLFQILFCYLIVNLSLNSRSIFGRRENRIVERLGDVSYGVYMYHMPIVFMMVLIAKNSLDSLHPILSTAIFYTAVIVLTLVVSFLSKRYFEDRFMSLRSKFT